MNFWLTNGFVLDLEAGTFKKANIQIKDGVISSIGNTPEKNDVVYDCTDKYLTPGLIDMHTHMVWNGLSMNPTQTMVNEGPQVAMLRAVYNAKKSVEKGVTTVRDVGACDDVTIHINHAIRLGLIENCCDIIPCGSAIMSSFGHVPQLGRIADSDGELQKAIRTVKTLLTEAGENCQWIKIMATGGAAGAEEVGPSMYSLEQLKLIVDEAHRLHMKVCAHALSAIGIENCIEAGIDCIEHGAQISIPYLQKMKEKGLAWVPTLSVYKHISESPDVLPANSVAKAAKVVENQKETFKNAMQVGIAIALGTDAGSMNFGEHPSVQREMSDMHSYGMSNVDVIRSATIVCAEVLGISNKIGSICEGKNADLLILSENPIENLNAFSNSLEQVYKNGVSVL